jgi:hypothetical protein
MKNFFVSLMLCALSGSIAYCDSLAPEIAPRAAKFEADSKSLDAARSAAMKRLNDEYLAYLATAERAASVSGKTQEVAVILKVKEMVGDGKPKAELPAFVPKNLQARHKEYVAATQAVDRDIAVRTQQANGSYLRDLAVIESQLPPNAVAREQIAPIKVKLVAAVSSVKPSLFFGQWIPGIYKGSRATISIKPDGTTAFDEGPTKGKWSAGDGYLMITWDNGVRWRMQNPESNPAKARLEEKHPGEKTWRPYTATRR